MKKQKPSLFDAASHQLSKGKREITHAAEEREEGDSIAAITKMKRMGKELTEKMELLCSYLHISQEELATRVTDPTLISEPLFKEIEEGRRRLEAHLSGGKTASQREAAEKATATKSSARHRKSMRLQARKASWISMR